MKKNLCFGFWRFNCIVFLSLLLLFMSSCQKEEHEANLPINENEGIVFHEGRLIFKDVETFMAHQKWLSENQNNQHLITERNMALGFKSMSEYYLDGIKLEENDPKFADYVTNYPNIFNKEIYDNSTLYVMPHSIILCYVVNEDGIFQVGDQIYRIVQNYIYRTGDESKIETLLLPKDQIPTKDIEISKTRPELETKSDLAQRTEYFTNDNRFRIVSSVMEYTITDQYLGTAWWYDIRTNPQKRTLGLWFTAQLSTKSANDDGYWYFPGEGVQYQIDAGYDAGTGVTQKNIVTCGGSPIDLNDSYCQAYSRGRLIDGYTQYIYIEWDNALSGSPSSSTRKVTYLSDPY
ncbi:MAG: hypothetical protein K9J25_13435 [Bacteroidales bacterium]|nr:hypothetical protein [Bacteroidales bacterium]